MRNLFLFGRFGNLGHVLTWTTILLIAAATRLLELNSLPPGIRYDTASNGVYALNVLFNSSRPLYINHLGAPEPLMVYLQSLSTWLFGANVFALRIVSATAGILSVAALYACSALTRDHRAAFVAAFAFAVAVEPINASRTGLRAALVPFIETAWLLFFWRAWRDGKARDFFLAGVSLGLGVYSYVAALMLPVIFLLLWAHQFLFLRERWRERWWPVVLMLAVSAVIATPRWLFQLTYPGASLFRATQVSIFNNPTLQTLGLGNIILGRLIAYAKMFGVEWQGELYNVLHQPLLDPILFACFLIGIAVCLARWRYLEWIWAPLMLGIMLLPDLLAANEPSPNELRTIGMIPPTFFLVGVGAASVLELFVQHRWSRKLTFAGTLAMLTAGAAIGWHAYFVDYAQAAHAGPDEDYNRTEIAEAKWIAQHSEPVYLPLNEYARSPVHYLAGARAARLKAALRGDGTLDPHALPSLAWIVLPTDHSRPRTEGRIYVNDPLSFVLVTDDTVYILPPTRADSLPVDTQLQSRTPSEMIRDEQGSIVASAYAINVLNNPFRFSGVARPQSLKFSQGIELHEFRLDTTRAQPGETISLTLFWQAEQKTTEDLAVFVHLIDFHENVAANADTIPALGAYPTYLWKPGEIVPTHHQIKIPPRTRPGKYFAEIGLYNLLDQNRLNLIHGDGSEIDSRVIVGSVKIAPQQDIGYNPSHTQYANFDNRITLLGYDAKSADLPREFRLSLYWQGLKEMDRDYTVFVHALDSNNNIVSQADHQPQDGSYPTSIWDAGENVRDAFTLTFPRDATPGKYKIKIGWYDTKTGERLPTRDAANQITGDSIILDNVLEIVP